MASAVTVVVSDDEVLSAARSTGTCAFWAYKRPSFLFSDYASPDWAGHAILVESPVHP